MYVIVTVAAHTMHTDTLLYPHSPLHDVDIRMCHPDAYVVVVVVMWHVVVIRIATHVTVYRAYHV